MPEDAQPNDLRGRSQASGVPSIRPAGNIPRNNHYASTARTSYKRPSDPSYVVSPKKRRKLVDRKEIEIQLPVGCRKGQNDCHTKRKEFIAREIERLQKPGLGLKVLSHTVKDDAVQFICTQEDIMNCFLAPSAPVKGGQQQHAGSQPKAEPLPQILSPPNPIISTIPVPLRVFKSGTLSFSADLSVGAETPAERVVNRPSGAFNTDLDHSVAVAELMFGKQGPPEPSSSGGATSAPAPSMNDPPVSLVVKPVPPRSQFQAPASIAQSASLPNKVQTAAKRPFVVHRPLGVFDTDLDHSIPVAELMFGKQGPPKPSSFIAAASASAPAKNHAPASGSGSRAVKSVPLQPRSQATVSTTQSVLRLNQAKTAEKKQSLSESVKSTPSTIPSSSLLRKVQTTAKQSLSSQPPPLLVPFILRPPRFRRSKPLPTSH
ncbi:hypothetical protein MVEN_01258800 [Mycena venus]|uniref:Uncharacterized protein n=1 Tax=Mycena venus TaxID=2733690 RepID=A0A8H7CWI4_9AGAR|nr:hypothetical protein MVEN_01258800 [Mycena venus]